MIEQGEKMQYRVPQFIEREMRLVGFLTVRQTLVLGAAAVILFILYFLLSKIFFTIAVVIIGGVSLIFAFGKINERNISNLLFSYIEFFLKPRIYLWGTENKNAAQAKITTTPDNQTIPQEQTEQGPTIQDIESLAKYLDQQ